MEIAAVENPAMQIRHATSPDSVTGASTAELRARYLVGGLFQAGRVTACYTHHDRMVLAGVVPGADGVALPTFGPLRSAYFLERREAGVVNVGTSGEIDVDGQTFALGHADVLYIGRGARDVTFRGDEQSAYYLVSAPAHEAYPTRWAALGDAQVSRLGEADGANVRTIRRYIHADGIRSSQLVLGVTTLEPGNMWNTMPCHTHDRRTEAYLYFDLDPEHRIIHLMGRPDETRNLVVADREAVIAPSWSVHCGFGTRSYSFVWAMAGENQAFEDMDHVAITGLR
jgi:4-deoxy-L-threo-5-hexosulose-uronate ketol-isomerase